MLTHLPRELLCVAAFIQHRAVAIVLPIVRLFACRAVIARLSATGGGFHATLMPNILSLLANAVISIFMRLQVEVIVLLPEGGYARGAGRSIFANQSWSFWTDLLLGGCFGEASVALGGSECTHRAASDSADAQPSKERKCGW